MNLLKLKWKSLFVLSVFLLFLTGCFEKIVNVRQVEYVETANVKSTISPTPTIENIDNTNGRIVPKETNTLYCRADGNDVSDKKSQTTMPKPKVWLLCPIENFSTLNQNDSLTNDREEVKVKLPISAEEKLQDYWFYVFSLNKNTELIEIINKRNDIKKELQNISIFTPNGLRNISLDEADNLTELIERQALEIKQIPNN